MLWNVFIYMEFNVTNVFVFMSLLVSAYRSDVFDILHAEQRMNERTGAHNQDIALIHRVQSMIKTTLNYRED